MGKPITAEQHNATRRATKGRRRSGRQQQTAQHFDLAAAMRERQKRVYARQQAETNGDYLLGIVDRQVVYRLKHPIHDMPFEQYWTARETFYRNVGDLLAAAKRSQNRYSWRWRGNDLVIERRNPPCRD